MVAIKVNTFGGMIPAVDDLLLPEPAAANAEDAWLASGTLVGLPALKLLHTTALATPKKVFRIPSSYSDVSAGAASVWLEFEDPDTDVLRAPVFGDTHDRYYWASSSAAPRYNTKARIVAGDDSFLLGVPFATNKPTVVPMADGTSEIEVTRSYVATWVSKYGEEGAPSPPATATGKQDDSWTFVLPFPGVSDLADRNLTHMNIYRTVTSRTGGASYFFVAQVDIDDEEYVDDISDTVVSANAQLQSEGWTPPPDDLEGFVMMPNGIAAAWRENELWFSEPYRPHAWPAQYVHTVEYPIVGLGVTNQTLVVCTTGFPMTAIGASPASITTSKVAAFEPCISRKSIVSTPAGVFYASPNGLVLIAPGRVENITRGSIDKESWQELTKLSAVHAARLETAYYAFGTAHAGALGTVADAADIGIFLDPTSQRITVSKLTSDDPTVAVFNDDWTGEVLTLRGNNVHWLDLADSSLEREPYVWRSKVFHLGEASNLGAAKIYFRVPDATPEQSAERDNTLEQTLGSGQYALFRVYADGRHVLTWEVRTSGELIRLPDGFKAEQWQFEIEGRVEITGLQVASSIRELSVA